MQYSLFLEESIPSRPGISYRRGETISLWDLFERPDAVPLLLRLLGLIEIGLDFSMEHMLEAEVVHFCFGWESLVFLSQEYKFGNNGSSPLHSFYSFVPSSLESMPLNYQFVMLRAVTRA